MKKSDSTKCDVHEKEINQIKKDFNNLRNNVNAKIDELIEEVRKPLLTDKQWLSLTIGAIIYVIGIVMYVGSTKSMAQNNKENDERIEEKHDTDVKRLENKQDYIIKILLDIKEDVGANKANK